LKSGWSDWNGQCEGIVWRTAGLLMVKVAGVITMEQVGSGIVDVVKCWKLEVYDTAGTIPTRIYNDADSGRMCAYNKPDEIIIDMYFDKSGNGACMTRNSVKSPRLASNILAAGHFRYLA